jgi:hypothetical protein
VYGLSGVERGRWLPSFLRLVAGSAGLKIACFENAALRARGPSKRNEYRFKTSLKKGIRFSMFALRGKKFRLSLVAETRLANLFLDQYLQPFLSAYSYEKEPAEYRSIHS